ncbi:hypothetical protein [Leucobacter musarum]|uniref:hypothetical protein n=1 Tax=Leucobacter musarum TaxID=1930747 RepID=UPI000B105B05|nr:hypothetical protein [Leucobacter musarum]
MRVSLRVFVPLGAMMLVCGLTGCAEEAPEPQELTVSQAGAKYLDAVCPVNAAWDDADVALDRLRLEADRVVESDSRDSENVDVTDFANRMRAVAKQSAEAASALTASNTLWPDAAADSIAEVARTLHDDEDQAARVAQLSAEKALDYRWEGAEDVGSAAASARAALGLPDDADAACAEWRDASDDAESAADSASPTPGASTSPDAKDSKNSKGETRDP